MKLEESKLAIKLHNILDVVLTIASFIWAYFIKKYLLPSPYLGLIESPDYYIILLLIIIVWFILFEIFGFYFSFLRRSFAQIFFSIIKATTTGFVIIIFMLYVFKLQDVSRLLMAMFYFLNVGSLTLSKWIIHSKYTKDPKSEYKFHNILIIGSKERARDVICAIRANKELGGENACLDPVSEEPRQVGYKIIGCIDIDKGSLGNKVFNNYEIIGTLEDLERILLEKPIDELFIAMPINLIKHVEKHIAFAGQIGVPVRIIPDWQIKDLIQNPAISFIGFEVFSGLATIVLSSVPPNREMLLIKNGIDYIAAALAIVFLFPLFLFVSIAIKLSSKGPIFYKQKRCGLNGRIFDVYKFRTMVADADKQQVELESLNEAKGPVFKIKKDPRIVPYVGTFLRRTFIDEIPQLINILKGEMSFIGPRPPIPSEVEKYEIWQRRRLSMKPGMTCMWQTSPNRHNISFDEWMKLDLYYIDNWSPKLDAKIFLNTLKVMLLGTGR